MNLLQRIDAILYLDTFFKENSAEWQAEKQKAMNENGWFVLEYIEKAIENIRTYFLQPDILKNWIVGYQLPPENNNPKTIGLVMAGNIPLVGFHDFLCCFLSGNRVMIKTSSKDRVLMEYLIKKMISCKPESSEYISFSEQLKQCDAYIATGSNNSSRYFEYYFSKYPHIIRKNRTSVAILTGLETATELENLADDIMTYFGLGCRNVTQVYIPKSYDFIPLLEALKKYSWAADHHKYRNNYDYNLALHMLNGTYYMTNESTLLIEHPSEFAPISQLHYQFYDEVNSVLEKLRNSPNIQAIVGHYGIPFGQVQCPTLLDYADGVDTMEWLTSL